MIARKPNFMQMIIILLFNSKEDCIWLIE